jgi:cystathionine beta-lyase
MPESASPRSPVPRPDRPRPPVARDPEFASCPDRRGTGAEKWDRWPDRDVIPVWVADMDFRAPAVVLDAIHARVEHGVFGYTDDPPGFAPALAGHLARLHGWDVDPTRIVGTPGVVTGLALSARLLTAADARIVTFTPVYPPFLTLPGRAGRRCVRVPLVQDHGALRGSPQAGSSQTGSSQTGSSHTGSAWTIDWDALEAALRPDVEAPASGGLFWLCHPHNPTGTVFTRAELLRIADLAERHDVTIVSDEIWSDLVLDPPPGECGHVPFASLDHPAARRAVTLTAPSKTWNLAGLGCAAVILPEPAVTKRFRPAGGGLVPMVNPLGYAAAEAAWTHGDPWRRKLVELLRYHRDLVQETVATLPGLCCVPARATYLAWIDCRGTGSADPQAACEAAGLGPSDGRDFGTPGFIRLNTACPTDRLEEALCRLRRAFSGA